ncbi:MAG: PAS domain-containing protein, partial [Gemmatimonadaceae bacterium]
MTRRSAKHPVGEPGDEALRVSEGPYRTLMEQAADAILVSDPAGNFIDANDMACRLIGYSREELLTLNITDTYPAEDLPLAASRSAALARGARVVAERRMRRKDGTDVLVSICVRRLADGRMQGIFHDLTEQKQAEEALRRSEEKFSKMFHSAPVGIAVSGLEDGVLFEVNREFERLLGYSRAESVGRPSSELGLWIDPALRARLIARLSEGTGVNDVEIALRAHNGSVVVVPSSFERLTLEGQSYLLSAFVDITESRVAREALAQSEAYFRSLIEQALDIITVLNPDGSIRYTSPANERVLGYSADEVQG